MLPCRAWRSACNARPAILDAPIAHGAPAVLLCPFYLLCTPPHQHAALQPQRLTIIKHAAQQAAQDMTCFTMLLACCCKDSS